MKSLLLFCIFIFLAAADEIKIDYPRGQFLPPKVSELITNELNKLNIAFEKLDSSSTVRIHSDWSKENNFSAEKCYIRSYSGVGDYAIYTVEVPAGIKCYDFTIVSIKRGGEYKYSILRPTNDNNSPHPPDDKKHDNTQK